MDIKKVYQDVANRFKTDDEMTSVGQGLGDVAKQIDEFKKPVSAPAPVKRPPASPADRINPKAKYGDKPGEQRINTDQMVKPLGQMHKGGEVPKTGAYILKKGEHVLTPEQKHHMSLASSVLSHPPEDKPEMPKKMIHEMRIRKSKSGHGHIIEHHHTSPMHHPREEHSTADSDSLVGHVMQHMTEPNPGEAEADAGHSGIPGEMPPSAGTQQMAQAVGGA